MPFTLAHAAAVLPLPRLLGRWGVPSALVIGSFMPDMGYFLALPVLRADTHSAAGLLWFCLPGGLLVYLLFHKLFKGPLLALLPAAWLGRLHAQVARCAVLPDASWAAVVLSLLCGAITHDVWDAFTHRSGWGVTDVAPGLLQPLFSLHGVDVHGYTVAQHGSTLAGLAVLALWYRRQLQRTPPQPIHLPVPLPNWGRLAVLLLLCLVPLGAGLYGGHDTVQAPLPYMQGWPAWPVFIVGAVWAALPALSLTLLAYALAWQAWRRRAAG